VPTSEETRVTGPPDDDAAEAGAADRKRRARRRSLAARDTLPEAERARRSAAVCARAARLPELQAASGLFLFAAFRSEVDTGPLIAWALEHGKAVCVPRVLGPAVMEAYRITDPSTDLAPGAWGIPEPSDDLEPADPKELDAAVVPGSVFDAAGRRCGYGGGFYDAYLPRLREGVPRIGLAFELQLVDELPCEPHDLPVHVVVTESRVLRPG
jgi:5-formyltetrahydrofolate cyclo-ligase